MAYAFVEAVQGSNGGGSNPSTGNFGSSVAVGDLLIATACGAAAGTFTFSDTLGNTYTTAQTISDPGDTGKKMQTAYCFSASAGTNAVTLSTTDQSDPMGIHCARYTSLASFDTSNKAQQNTPGTGTDAVTVSATNSNNPALQYAVGWYVAR